MKRRRRPVVLVTGPDKGGLNAWIFTWIAIALGGGRARRVTPRRYRRRMEEGKSYDFDALVIGGGADVDPSLYGETVMQAIERDQAPPDRSLTERVVALLFFLARVAFSTKSFHGRDPDRDEMELALIARAVEGERPLLGICRGAQLLNVYFGGSLHQSLDEFYIEEPQPYSFLPKKAVRVESRSRLARLLGGERFCVNSLHRQAVRTLGEELDAVAWEPTGVVQAVEHRRLPFVIGVQWHPEYLLQLREQRSVFAGLLAAARGA